MKQDKRNIDFVGDGKDLQKKKKAINKSYKARTTLSKSAMSLLEAVIDTACRIGLPVYKRDQAILMMTLEGISPTNIAKEFEIPRDEVIFLAEKAMKELRMFLVRMNTDEMQQKQFETLEKNIRKTTDKTIEDLRSENNRLKEENKELHQKLDNIFDNPEILKEYILNQPIYRLPISGRLQSVFLRSGLDMLKDVLDPYAPSLKNLPYMTPELIKELEIYLDANGIERENL